jgi:hypothetical protein
MSIKANQTDSIATAGGIDDNDTSMTLTTGAFDTKTSGDKRVLIIDYDNLDKLEVVKAYVNGTAVTSMTRAQDGTAAVAHSQGAQVCSGPVPSDLDYWLHNDYGRAWTSWTPTITVSGGTAPNYGGSFTNYYIQIGKLVFAYCYWTNSSGGTAGSGTNNIVFTLPVNSNNTSVAIGHGYAYESGGTIGSVTVVNDAAGTASFRLDASGAGLAGNDQSSTSRTIRITLMYEAA